MIKHSQITQSNKFAISLQYLKKEVRSRGHFWHADQRQSFYKLVLSFLMEVARHVQNTQNRKLVIFLQYVKKNCCNCFVFYCDAKHSDILRGSSHVRCYMFCHNFCRHCPQKGSGFVQRWRVVMECSFGICCLSLLVSVLWRKQKIIS